MAVTLNASTTTGLVQSADTSGIIELQNNGTTKLTVNSGGVTIPTLTTTTISDGTNSTSATNPIRGSAKAWVSFNGSSASIYNSYNVSSITRASTGLYTANYTNALSVTNYCVQVTGSGAGSGGSLYAVDNGTLLTTSVSFRSRANNTGAAVDEDPMCVSVFA
jgi:hypothetical protein